MIVNSSDLCAAGFDLREMIPLKREVKRIHKNGCRYNERLNVKTEGSQRHKKRKERSVLEECGCGKGGGVYDDGHPIVRSVSMGWVSV